MKVEQTTLDISGMSCAVCANRIEKGLAKMSGISHVNVNFALEKAYVKYSPNGTSLSAIVKQVEQLGYGAAEEIKQSDATDPRKREIKHLKVRFYFSMLLSFPLNQVKKFRLMEKLLTGLLRLMNPCLPEKVFLWKKGWGITL